MMSEGPTSGIGVDELVADLRQAGVCEDDILVVHSSLRSIGHVDGGPSTVVESLVQAVGPGGTVLFPALTIDGSVTEFMRRQNVVDLRESPPTTGAISRAAAVREDALRSAHPTHSVVAIGGLASELLSGNQSGQGPCGTESPFCKAAQAGGKILMIGTRNSTNTTLHTIEEIAAPYIFIGETFDMEVIDLDGQKHRVAVKGYTTSTPRNFNGIELRLLEEGIMTIHRLGQAEMRVIDGKRLLTEGTEWVRQQPFLLAEVDNNE